MKRRRTIALASALVLALSCTDEPPTSPSVAGPSLHRQGGGGPREVIVDPRGHGQGVVTTIQAGIDLVAPGGRVIVRPGTYAEAPVIAKAVTLEGTTGDGPATIELPGAPEAITIATPDPVAIRHLTIHRTGVDGILGNDRVDLTVEHVTMVATASLPGTNRGIRLNNDGSTGASHLVVRESSFDGGDLAGSIAGVSIAADVHGVIENNTFAHGAGQCLFAFGRTPNGLELDILNNTMDLCRGGAGAIDIGTVATGAAILGQTGTVNIIGNTIRNTDGSCLPATAIRYELYSGRIERNTIIAFVQACTAHPVQALPAAIQVGSVRDLTYTPASPVIRFNDIAGNSQAGLRIAPNVKNSIDARCNWWGSASGPSVTGGAGTGDAIVVETGAALPVSAPFATGPIAQRRHDRHRTRKECHVDFSLWSEPVNLGPTINTADGDQNGSLSADALTLYFVSNRAGGLGGTDVWASRRASPDDPWGTPFNLGAPINSTSGDGAPAFSPDGRTLFFMSSRPGGAGGADIYVTHRTDPTDDFGWGPPVPLGPDVNTAADEQGEHFLPGTHGRGASLYFNRGTGNATDIYVAPVGETGETLGPAVLVAELSDPTAFDQRASVRADEREVIFASNRAGSIGLLDLWTATRDRAQDAWSTPVNLGVPLNTSVNDQQPNLSADGRTLIFTSSKPGGSGGNDLWMSTRTPIGRQDGHDRHDDDGGRGHDDGNGNH